MPRIGAALHDVEDDDMPRDSWIALESGDYPFMITDTEYKSTKAGNGMCLHVTLHCIHPDHSRVELRDFLTLEHPNPDTVRIAKGRLKQIGLACKVKNPDFIQDSEELHNIPFVASVSKEEAQDPKYGDVDGYENRIAKYKQIDGNAPMSEPLPEQSQPTQASGDLPF